MLKSRRKYTKDSSFNFTERLFWSCDHNKFYIDISNFWKNPLINKDVSYGFNFEVRGIMIHVYDLMIYANCKSKDEEVLMFKNAWRLYTSTKENRDIAIEIFKGLSDKHLKTITK